MLSIRACGIAETPQWRSSIDCFARGSRGAALSWGSGFLNYLINYHWILLLFNQITNTYYDWPLSTRNFQRFVSNKYSNPDAAHHYEISQSSGGDWVKIKVESDVSGAAAVTNLEYESTLQDVKRDIRILQPRFLGQFKAEFGQLLEDAKD